MLIFCLSECNHKSQTIEKTKDINSLYEYVNEYYPEKINSLNDEILNQYDFKDILYSKKENSSLQSEIVYILLLKQYLYHLKTANQSYNLLDFQDKSSKEVINFFLKQHDIKNDVEFISSSICYHVLKNKSINSKEVRILIKQIEFEEERIENN